MKDKSNIITIHVYLLNESADVWRPVDTIHIKGNIYQIKPESIIPKTETWQFLPSDLVRCVKKQLKQDSKLMAIEKVEIPV